MTYTFTPRSHGHPIQVRATSEAAAWRALYMELQAGWSILAQYEVKEDPFAMVLKPVKAERGGTP